MGKGLLDLPTELLEVILFHIVGQPWKEDVSDFLSFTSTCRELRRLARDERYWRTMAQRRDRTCENPPENTDWFEFCKQIYRQRTVLGVELKEFISQYNDDYFCILEKVSMWPNKIRVYIDQRGDNSLGYIQNPSKSIVALAGGRRTIFDRLGGIKSNHAQFSIADQKSRYLGYLDFPCSISLDDIGKNLYFQYGSGGYRNTVLFHIDQAFLDRYNLTPLLRNSSGESPSNSSEN